MNAQEPLLTQPDTCVFCGRETTIMIKVPLELGGRYSTKYAMATVPGHASCLGTRLVLWFISSAGLMLLVIGGIAKWGGHFMSPGALLGVLLLSVILVPYGGAYLLFEWLVAGPARGYAGK